MNKMQRLLAVSAAAWGLALPGSTWAQMGSMSNAVAAPASAASWTDGEIRKVDVDAGKVTIKHGPIENLGMPAMTMTFRAKNSAQMAQLKSGDRVQFTASEDNGKLVLDAIRSAR